MPVVGYVSDAPESLGSKERIFHAVMSVALRNGFGKVTLNLVAREAGLSKGGLLHHFATKNELIQAMLEFYAAAVAPHAPSLHPGEANSSVSGCDPFAVAVLIAAAENPALLEPFGEILRPVETGPGRSPEPARSSLPLIGSLANRLGFDTSRLSVAAGH